MSLGNNKNNRKNSPFSSHALEDVKNIIFTKSINILTKRIMPNEPVKSGNPLAIIFNKHIFQSKGIKK